MFENRALRRIFGPKRDQVTGEWRIMCRVMICTAHPLGDQIKKNELGGASSTYGGELRCIQDFGGEICGKETTCKTQA